MHFEIILIRHGETEYNLAGRIQGSMDSPLSKLGERQARLTGNLLEKYYKNIDSWYVSPQGRARQTSEIIRDAMQSLPLPEESIHTELREIECGDWEGKLHSEVNPEKLDTIRNSADIAYPGGESLMDLIKRAESFFHDWLATIPQAAEEHRTVVVAHGNLIRALSAVILGGNANFAMRALAHNCAINRFLARDRRFYFRLAAYNCISHLHDGNSLPDL